MCCVSARACVSLPQAAAKKLLRSISGIHGISDRALASVLAWVREHPEVQGFIRRSRFHEAVLTAQKKTQGS